MTVKIIFRNTAEYPNILLAILKACLLHPFETRDRKYIKVLPGRRSRESLSNLIGGQQAIRSLGVIRTKQTSKISRIDSLFRCLRSAPATMLVFAAAAAGAALVAGRLVRDLLILHLQNPHDIRRRPPVTQFLGHESHVWIYMRKEHLVIGAEIVQSRFTIRRG